MLTFVPSIPLSVKHSIFWTSFTNTKTVVCDQSFAFSFAGRFVDKSVNMANSNADQVMETKRTETTVDVTFLHCVFLKGPPQIACKAGAK